MANKTHKISKLSEEEQLDLTLMLAQEYFWLFCMWMDKPHYSKRSFLQDVAEKLEDVAKGRLQKLAISMPPRGGKSYILSDWCAWLIGRGKDDPHTSIMRNSYGATLAEKFSRDIKQIIESPRYKQVFPGISYKPNRESVDDWAIMSAAQSTYFCAGVGGAITGKGCRTAAIADDLIKNLEEALSPNRLDAIWGWYTSTHLSRMEKGCPEIIVATRWSKKDPIGMVLEKEPGEWTTVVIPALDSNDETFCEDVRTTEEYRKTRNITEDMVWRAEYMQEPIESKGLLYPKDDLNYFTMDEISKYYDPNHEERFDSCFGWTDVADEGTDYLASGAVKVLGDKLYLVDVVFTQDPIELTQPRVAQLILDQQVQQHEVESNNGGKSYALRIRELVQQFKGRCTVSWKPNSSNKETRIIMAAGMVKSYMYFRSDYAPGSDYAKFMAQLTGYVRMGKNDHDDAPDLVTGLVNMVLNPAMRFFKTK